MSIPLFKYQLNETETVNFFKRLKQNDIFTYSDSYLWGDVLSIASKYGVIIRYCPPASEEYKTYGSHVCKVLYLNNEMKIEEKIQDGYYETRIQHPEYPKKVCKQCNTPFISVKKSPGPKREIPNFCSNCGHPIKDEYENDLKVYNVIMQNMHQESKRLLNLFKTDALEYCGLSNYPKAQQVWNYAWEESHSSGLINVLATLEELSELVILRYM